MADGGRPVEGTSTPLRSAQSERDVRSSELERAAQGPRVEPPSPVARGASRQTFPKSLRLLSRADFLRVQGKGAKVSAEPLVALALKNGREVTRVGMTVSSKVGNAVVRARLRRLLRELFRKRRHEWPQGLDVVLIAKNSAKDASFAALSRAFDALAVKIPRQVK